MFLMEHVFWFLFNKEGSTEKVLKTLLYLHNIMRDKH
jgi:hypothetical protein